ncbi:hypothetical protein HPB50_025899 [Hyalomma asiaticum]|uniref:Uncharacterized protein n=1 Tax=Hyalomma asiaticum TaxID=266040 RepID=A0ACB7RSR2_HYAAI|nr:hypothetical protein HPB50_025899 [Hyalomma asiaticum]
MLKLWTKMLKRSAWNHQRCSKCKPTIDHFKVTMTKARGTMVMPASGLKHAVFVVVDAGTWLGCATARKYCRSCKLDSQCKNKDSRASNIEQER